MGVAIVSPRDAAIGSERAAPGKDGETIGLVLTSFLPAMTEKPNCPKGMNKNLEQLYSAAATPAERQRLATPAGQAELRRKTMVLADGPFKGKPICHYPTMMTTPAHVLVEGSEAVPGLDLDGLGSLTKPKAGHCAHQNFADASGRATIDNQMYRVQGCTLGERKGGILHTSSTAELVNGAQSIVLEIAGVDNRVNDPDVQVSFYYSPDPTPFSRFGKPLSGGSLTVTPNKKYWAKARGRIANGVLTTDAADVMLYTPQLAIKIEQWLRQARLQLTFKPDGSATGVLAGYRPIDHYYYNQVSLRNHPAFGDVGAYAGNFMCPSYYRALQEQADGLFNPATGKCEGISSALVLTAHPAYVIK